MIYIVFTFAAIMLMLCTIIELALSRNTAGGILMQSSLPWLIAGWCIWLAGFYVVRKWNKSKDEYEY